MLISHVDLRVRDRARAEAFYGPLLEMLDARSRRGEEWTSFAVPAERSVHWLGFITRRTAAPCFFEDAGMMANATRIAFVASSRERLERIAERLPQLGAQTIEGPDTSEGYYAVFFQDPDGNRLEIMCASGG